MLVSSIKEIQSNPWVGRQDAKVQEATSAPEAAKIAAQSYFRPKAEAYAKSIDARMGNAQRIADISKQGNPFGGTALADQSNRATMMAQAEQAKSGSTPKQEASDVTPKSDQIAWKPPAEIADKVAQSQSQTPDTSAPNLGRRNTYARGNSSNPCSRHGSS
jgi:hypothetical protein